MQASTRVRGLKPFLVMDVLERAQALEREGRDVVHMEIGEPDFVTPAPVARAAARALGEGRTHYTHSQGVLELRQGLADHYRQSYGLDIDPGRFILTSGSSPAMLAALQALLEPGQTALLTDPGYACYPNFVRMAGGVPRAIATAESDGFHLTPDRLQAALIQEPARALILNSPSNPAGTRLDTRAMRDLAAVATAAGCWVVSDELYHGLHGQGAEPDHCMLEFTDRAFVVNGFSKTWAMTGWRLGWLIVPDAFVPDIRRLCQNLFICAGDFIQWAGLAALTECRTEVLAMAEAYAQRRTFVLDRLKAMGLRVAGIPAGAFYCMVDFRPWLEATGSGVDSIALAFDILETAGVALTPGVDFGPGGEGFLRISFASSLERLGEGLDRLEGYLRTRRLRDHAAQTTAEAALSG